MYDPNNYNNPNGEFRPYDPEQRPNRKNEIIGKIIAGVLAVVLVGGAAGFGGAYLARSGMLPDGIPAIAGTEKAEDEDAYDSDENEEPEYDAPEETAAAQNENGSSGQASALTETNASSDSNAIKKAIKKATPSVVFITANFNNTSKSSGTGIVFSSDGYIITNAHVILSEESQRTNYNYTDPFSFFEDFYNYNYGGYSGQKNVVEASEVTVTLHNGKEYKAKIIGSDANTDLALLKINASGLTAAEIGNSSSLEMGDTAITLGYPLGLGLSASTGIISGLEKEMTVEVAGGSATMVLLQTDASINPGNSGGPLLNSRGQVIGITSSKIVSSSVDGVGFAIPITDALPIIEELMTTGKVKSTLPKMGITGKNITPSVKRYYNLPVDNGVLVSAVEAGSCAEKAGIAEGDIIVGADGKEVKDMETLVSLKNKHKAGDKMTVTLARKGGNVDVELILEAAE